VGEDQVQHIEVCRDLARRFNHYYGEVFRIPRPKCLRPAPSAGVDGEKMSKSYDNTIEIFEAFHTHAQKDHANQDGLAARGGAEKNRLGPALSTVLSLRRRSGAGAMAATYRRGGFGSERSRKQLADAAADYFAEARARRQRLAADLGQVQEILADGARRARRKARRCWNGPNVLVE